MDDYSDTAESDADPLETALDPDDMLCNAASPIGYKRPRAVVSSTQRKGGNKRVKTTVRAGARRGASRDAVTDTDNATGDDASDDIAEAAELKELELQQKSAEKRAKNIERQHKTEQRKKLQVRREMEKKQKEAIQRMKLLRGHPKAELIDLVPVLRNRDRDESGQLYQSETASNKRKLMRWQITMSDGRKTTFPGITTVLNKIMYSEPEPCKYGTTSEDAVGYEQNTIGDAVDTVGQTLDGPHEDVCGMDNEAACRKGDATLKCIGRGQEHGTLVHEQVSWVVQRWIQEYPAFPTDDLMSELNNGTLDPCVYKIVTLLMEIEWTPIMSEYYVYDETLRLATAVDLVCLTHSVQRLAFIEIKTSTRKDALNIFMNGDTTRGRRPRYMQGMLENHVLDTGYNRAVMQLMATEAIMCNSYTECRPHAYQIVFVSSDMPKAELISIPAWCWSGGNMQLGMNRRIIYNMLSQYASHLRLKTAAQHASGGLLLHSTDTRHCPSQSDNESTIGDDMLVERRARTNVVSLMRSSTAHDAASDASSLRSSSITGQRQRMLQHALRRRRSRTMMAAKTKLESGAMERESEAVPA